jgi:hypothetical protein
MDKLKKLLERFSFESNILSAVVGIALISSIMFISVNPGNKSAILAACISGGSLYILNGLKLIVKPKKNMAGMTYLLMGIILVVLGFVILQLVQSAKAR